MSDVNDLLDRLKGWSSEEYPLVARLLSETKVKAGAASEWSAVDLESLGVELTALDIRLSDRVTVIDRAINRESLPTDGHGDHSGPAGPARKSRRLDNDGGRNQGGPTRRSNRSAVLARRDSMMSLADSSDDGMGGSRTQGRIPTIRLPRDVSQMSLRRQGSGGGVLSRSGSVLSLASAAQAESREARRKKKNKLLKKVQGRRPSYDAEGEFEDGSSESETDVRRRKHNRRQAAKEMEKVLPHYKFWHDLDSYFQPITDDLIRLLHPVDDDPRAAEYQVPPPSKQHLSEQWRDDDPGVSASKKNNKKRKGAQAQNHGHGQQSGPGEPDDNPSLSQHTLAQRILGALVEEKLAMPPVDDGDDGPGRLNLKKNPDTSGVLAHAHAISLQDRIMAELRAIGMYAQDEEPDLTVREDDEICARLRLYQSQLHEVRRQNNYSRKRLLSLVTNTMVLQDRQAKLRSADKAVIDGYKKRRAVLKGASKGRKVTEKGIGEARIALDRREELLSANAAVRAMPGIQPLHYTTYVASGLRSAYERYSRHAHGHAHGHHGHSHVAPSQNQLSRTVKLPSARSLATLPHGHRPPATTSTSGTAATGNVNTSGNVNVNMANAAYSTHPLTQHQHQQPQSTHAPAHPPVQGIQPTGAVRLGSIGPATLSFSITPGVGPGHDAKSALK